MTATTDWTPVVVVGLSMLVPPNWDGRDLANQDLSKGFTPNPGTCRDAWFHGEVPRAFIGEADPNIGVECVAVSSWPIAAVDGVWAHEVAGDSVRIGPVLAHGTIDRLEVSVGVQTLPENDSIDPVLDVIVHAPDHVVRISIGVGTDATTARTILHSFHAA